WTSRTWRTRGSSRRSGRARPYPSVAGGSIEVKRPEPQSPDQLQDAKPQALHSRKPQAASGLQSGAIREPLMACACQPLAACGLGLHCELTGFKTMNDVMAQLLAHDRVRAARHHIERTDEVTLARQAALSA